MASFSTSLSGLNANALALSVISNNLANLNTVAYKDMTPVFGDLFYQTVGANGAGNPIQVGVGSSVVSLASPFTQGSIDATGVPTDVAIQGDGFFILSANGKQAYTRSGNFSVNATGNLISNQGGQVLGYPAQSGVINPSQTLAPLSLSAGQSTPPKATADIQLAINLNSSAPVSTPVPPATTAPVTFSTPMVVFDSLGKSHVMTFDFTKTAANTWSYNVSIPAADVGASSTPPPVASGSLTFDGGGNLTSPAAGAPVQIQISNFADGAKDLSVNWNLFDSSGSALVTQVAGSSQTSATQQDGYTGGTLQSISIGTDGSIQGVFTNGQTTLLGQVAIANFADPEGLARDGGNNFSETLASGLPNVGTPGTGGRGSIMGGSLERSNVDIATEFARLITAQRGYQANARVITTADEVIQEAINLKR